MGDRGFLASVLPYVQDAERETGFWAELGESSLEVLVFGAQFGAVYALVALGVALVYKSTRVLNFAQGEFGTVPAFLAYTIMVGNGSLLAGWRKRGDIGAEPDAGVLLWAAAIAVVAGAIIAILINGLVVRRLASASPVTSLVATAGVALMLVSLQVIFFEAQRRNFPRFIKGAPCIDFRDGKCVPFKIGGVTVPWHTIIVVGVLIITVTLLALLFRTKYGVALLATAQEPFAAELQGISVAGMSTLAWGTAGALGALAGVLGGGVFEGLQPGLMTTQFLIPAFTAAVLGGITSMVGAVVGGLVLGIVVALANELNLQFALEIPGAPQVTTFLVLLLVLSIRPRGLLGKEA